MAELKFQVSLRIRGDGLIPDDVTELIDCVPSQCHAQGDEIQSEHFVRRAPTGVWILRNDKAENLDSAIGNLLDQVTHNQEAWLAVTENLQAEILIGVFSTDVQAGFTIAEQTVKNVAKVGIALSFDVYLIEGQND